MDASSASSGPIEPLDKKLSHVIHAIENDIEEASKCPKCGKPEISVQTNSAERRDGDFIHLAGALVLLLAGLALAVMTGYAFIEQSRTRGVSPVPLGLAAAFCFATGQRLSAIYCRKKSVIEVICRCTACDYQWVDKMATHVLTLVNALSHKEDAVRKKAIQRLGDTQHPMVADALIAVGAEGKSHEEVDETAKALARIGTARAARFILDSVKDRWDSLGAEARSAIGDIRNADAIDTLAEALESDIKYVQIRAAFALGEIGGEKAEAVLNAALEKESKAAVKRHMEKALQKVKRNSAQHKRSAVQMASDAQAGGQMSVGSHVLPEGFAKTSKLAVASLILGILGPGTFGVGAIVGLAFGIAGLKAIKDTGGQLRGRGLAIAGICISILAILVSILSFWRALFSGAE